MTEIDQELDQEELRHLLDLVQDGVVSRAQLVALGAQAHDIARLVRRRELTPVHRGVFVNHTGPLTREHRCWAAVLVHWPAALDREWALRIPRVRGRCAWRSRRVGL